MSLEPSPVSLHGLTHRELGDYTNTYALLMETGNPSQGRLRGYTDEDLVKTGEDPCYVIAYDLGLLYVTTAPATSQSSCVLVVILLVSALTSMRSTITAAKISRSLWKVFRPMTR